MSIQRKLMFFGAHPDDETFGNGATLAQYVLRGVKVYVVCSTRGEEGTVDPELMQGYSTIGDLRWHEMKNAAGVLGLADFIHLGYRDSGMQGSEHNSHPDALAMAPVDEVAGKMVKIIRTLKPDVVLTHDAGGGYGHPDHIATHNAAVKAFYAAADPAQYPGAGPAFKPSKLYFGVRPFKDMKLMIKLMPLFGQDPHHFGRNKDIDFTKVMGVEYPVNAVVRLTKQAREIRVRAAACHASQGGGQTRGGPLIFRISGLFRQPQDHFMREYPPPNQHLEKDLFEGLPD
jgi:N-acetyl-1-D-myo-inositol-2-amino-2-deoxy-alpha-D-glucopyranoside deacetylase